MSTVISGNAALRRWSIDALLEVYVSWREECHAVCQAYQWWADSDGGQRGLAYAAYLAALDREERAARVYADQVDRVSRICR